MEAGTHLRGLIPDVFGNHLMEGQKVWEFAFVSAGLPAEIWKISNQKANTADFWQAAAWHIEI